MSFENGDQHSPDQPTELNDETQKKLKISYTRDFLLSLSDLDACKALPSGFDRSILSEFEDTSQDRQRTTGGLSLNSFRRIEYGSSPPTRGDLPNNNRGIHGRWEGRSSGKSDRESDSQSDWDSDSGRRYGNQSRRPWQVPEHDGLLGSGSFPRPSGYAAGASAPKVRQSEHYQLNRSIEPYHPPRPYKAVPHSRRETTDSLNDETFGSSEFTSEDRAEEERKRRASFELMRKEQHKSFQDKQKLNVDKNKDDFDISTLREESEEEKRSLKRGSESDEPVIPLGSDNDTFSEKSFGPSQTSASRPLVPPGFKSTILDKNLGAKSSNHSHAVEVGSYEHEDNLLHGQSKSTGNATSNELDEKQLAEGLGLRKQQHESTSTHGSIDNQSGKGLGLSSALDVSDKSIGTDSILYNKPNINEASIGSEHIELNAEKVTAPSVLGESNQVPSTSILDKLFGSALALNVAGSSSALEYHDNKEDETPCPHTVQSSKFAHWFREEERKPSKNQSSGQPNNLLSLIVGSEKDGSRGSGNASENILPPLKNSKIMEKTSDVTVGSFDPSYKNSKPQLVSAVLTCEDLEQSILSEISDTGSVPQPPVRSCTDTDRKTEKPKANNDNLASQHLLSLLQKGTSLKDMESSSNLDKSSSDNVYDIEEASVGSALHNSIEGKVENVSDSAKTLTLETLFGSAFMKELQTVGAPVSIQRSAVGSSKIDVSEPHGFPFSVVDNLLPTSNDIGFSTTVHDSSVFTANNRKQTKFDKIEEQWLSFDNRQGEQNTSQLRTNIGSKIVGFDVPADVRLPEEDSLITVSEPLNVENFMPTGNSGKTELLSSSNPQVDFAEKLATFNSVLRDDRSIRGGQEPPFLRGPYDMRESSNPYENLNVQASFAQLHHPQLNNVGPLFHHLDSHPVNISSQMKFMAPEAVTHHDPAQNHQIPVNMRRPPFHHSGTGPSGFDQPIPHPLLQQMHMPGNFPPNMLQGLPRGPALPPHPNRSASMPAHPNFGSIGMPQPAPDIGGGSNHPEALQRLIEMELRSNPKQMRPFAAGGGGGQSHGMYGRELDMGFGFR
ncbi:chorismate synthase [Parasponia andersonii]|uniref:Chorismate synthase n=1 Tax=Parasponia andersonii TaxID=3476 RepID=A0A2P5D479_PARAD|nr:chorismate synthase [Parasponia andersonii]